MGVNPIIYNPRHPLRCNGWRGLSFLNPQRSIHTNTDLPLKVDKDLRGWFSPGKAEDAGGLSPAKDDNAAWRKADRKDCLVLMGVQYKASIGNIKAALMAPIRIMKRRRTLEF